MFKNAFVKFPEFKSSIFSYVKVENVVSPPSIPVTKNDFKFGFSGKDEARLRIKPIKNPPSTFTKSVPIGNAKFGKSFAIKPLDKALKTAPINPPLPMQIILIMLISFDLAALAFWL